MQCCFQFLFRPFLLISMIACCQLAMANTKADETAQVRASLKQHLPELVIENITASPVADLYQVTAGAAVLYVSKNGRYVVSGDIIDLEQSQQNLTENARKQARLAGLKALGDKNMIIFSPKDPKYTVTVFTDVDCGYCRKLQSEIAEINAKGIAIRYLAFPRTGPNTPTYEKMVKVWCAKDKQKAMAQASGGDIDGALCTDNTVQKEFQLGMMMGINGTPTMIFEDGTIFPGYLPPEKLLEAAKQIREEMTKKA